MKKKLDFDIVVIANKHRKPIILPYLEDVPYKIYYTPDFDLPPRWQPNPIYKGLVVHMHQHIGQHRCLEGHKNALNLAKKKNILVLEDDAEPNRPDWLDICISASSLLSSYEIVSVHSREPNYKIFNKELFDEENKLNAFFAKDNTSPRRCLGTLAYFIGKENISRLQDHNYNGLPIDLFLCNCFNFCFVEPSPFNHNRSQGSLIDL
ncbi:MAG: hypothetical protein RBR32_01695 [Bacteroidales bacterium]|nr:hypothetical protein [Bacteroidales bacterium]